MYYALYKPSDGEEPGWRVADGPEDVANPGEVIVELPGEPVGVWDAARGALREKTAGEQLDKAREAKRAELSRAFVVANTTLYPETEPEYAIWLAVPEYAATPNGERPKAVRANITRLRERLAAVDAATSVAAVEAVRW